MSKPHQQPRTSQPASTRRNTNAVAPKQQDRLIALYRARQWSQAEAMARELAQKHPKDPFAWKSLGSVLLESGQWHPSLGILDRALTLDPNDPETHNAMAQALYRLGRAGDAVEYLEKALELKPGFKQARLMLIKLYNDAGGFQQALEHVAVAERNFPDDGTLLSRKAHALIKLTQFGEGIRTHESIVAKFPNDPIHLSNLASAYRNVGRFKDAENYYLKALELAPHQEKTYSNYLMAMHYNPAYTAEDLFKAHREWDVRFRPVERKPRPRPADLSHDRRLRIGMISAGFRIHPVGQMITSAIEALPREDFEIFAYTVDDTVDALTRRMQQRADRWMSVTHLDEKRLAKQLREDRIDILLDLCGHTEGSRLLTIAHEPAPLHVKWVGGLINTTGLQAMDYLLSDAVETPPGVDDQYIEKLIRLPDDYICYMPRGNAPELSRLPALDNGYVTFGCFNNPSKLNDVVLGKWASIMHRVADSRLFLKGMQFDSEEFVERTRSTLERLGVERHRLILEGHSQHYQLLEAYNRVDIALDPWPYSGGLTTCEALLMGVPVITLPGPSFAGRHSATHLTNAGLPELVVDSWERYESLAIELASDLASLSRIRRGLRQQLKRSPVCDYKRFARHLGIALRAIWQRYCDDKAPAALTFNKDGQAWFDGEEDPVSVKTPRIVTAGSQTYSASFRASVEFNWQLPGKIIAIDNTARLVRESGFRTLLDLNAFGVVAFDPGSRVENPERFDGCEDVQLLPHAVLGNGQPATLYACLAPEMSGTLKPLPSGQLPELKRQGARVLTTLPITSIALDSIEGLQTLDWLILDDQSDAMAILEHGGQALLETLLIQVRISFQPTHERQPSLTEICHWMSGHGFRFYRLNDLAHRSHLPARDDLQQYQATELESADALFLPDCDRMASMDENQKLKLAFLLHTVFGVKDFSYSLISSVNPEKAERYLQAEGLVAVNTDSADAKPDNRKVHSGSPGNEGGIDVPDAPFMSQPERELFRKSLQGARRYFEFGSGGSTVWAVEQGLTVYGVESDKEWVNALQRRLGDTCQVKAVDIGPIGEWGYPLSLASQHKFSAYSRAIHEHDTGFDLILVDGRFRVACTLSAIEHILTRNRDSEMARIFIHDFWNRPQYHSVLEFLHAEESIESAGVFRIKPDIDMQKLKSMWNTYSHQPA
ncbi:tetratricopeptide repeat protein [Microbulbifer magnicolonia]|uniref:O-linked N-acetylglucosamine transferase family protein n=1 Tax=Microbulbifer magnicolonia TaxID=3109744 RepID=UPI002B402FA4|nr:tetratricopeptide repeat protein [Microbulbifer sp. GG15]